MYFMLTTRETSQVSKGWSKTRAHRNVAHICVTAPVFQSPNGWLKASAPWNR